MHASTQPEHHKSFQTPALRETETTYSCIKSTDNDVVKMQERELTCVGATALSVQLRRTVKVEHPGVSLSCEAEPGTETEVSAQRLWSAAAASHVW